MRLFPVVISAYVQVGENEVQRKLASLQVCFTETLRYSLFLDGRQVSSRSSIEVLVLGGDYQS